MCFRARQECGRACIPPSLPPPSPGGPHLCLPFYDCEVLNDVGQVFPRALHKRARLLQGGQQAGDGIQVRGSGTADAWGQGVGGGREGLGVKVWFEDSGFEGSGMLPRGLLLWHWARFVGSGLGVAERKPQPHAGVNNSSSSSG